MKVEVSASVCCSCEATRISVEKGVAASVEPAAVAVASNADLRGPRGTGRKAVRWQHAQPPPPILLLRVA
ncbi:hypothetical protein GCM10010353_29240 [Streptomyces chryseus]|nr:hypothetical protein GCM10010353_29240 [Streptomyces chryseus]